MDSKFIKGCSHFIDRMPLEKGLGLLSALDAYPSGHLLPFHSGLAYVLHLLVETNLIPKLFDYLNFPNRISVSSFHILHFFLKGYPFLPKIFRRRFSSWYNWKPMATIGNRRLPSVTIGRYQILPMVTDGRTPNAPIVKETLNL